MKKKKVQKLSKPLRKALIELEVVSSRLFDLSKYTERVFVDLCNDLGLDSETLEPQRKTILDELGI